MLTFTSLIDSPNSKNDSRSYTPSPLVGLMGFCGGEKMANGKFTFVVKLSAALRSFFRCMPKRRKQIACSCQRVEKKLWKRWCGHEIITQVTQMLNYKKHFRAWVGEKAFFGMICRSFTWKASPLASFTSSNWNFLSQKASDVRMPRAWGRLHILGNSIYHFCSLL